jgi:hypothetical protein
VAAGLTARSVPHRLTDADRRRLDAEIDRLAGQGLRVRAVADRSASAAGTWMRNGLTGWSSSACSAWPTGSGPPPPKRYAGSLAPVSTLVMATGDHQATAESIAA